MTGNQGFRVDPRGVVPRQNSGTFDFHLGNNVTNLSRNSLISKVARHFGEAQPKSITLFNVFLSSPAENHSMSRKLARLLLSPPLYFSYGQFGVIDRDSDLHGLYWEERHNSQGFARRDSIACFRTLAVHGYTDVSVALGPYEPAANYDRVISVPFHVRSGIVAVEGPEEVNLVKRNVELAPGNYRLTAAQQYAAAEGREETIDLYFERVDEPLKRSEVLLADEELNPVYPLLETADEP